jgi:hypothetical protein
MRDHSWRVVLGLCVAFLVPAGSGCTSILGDFQSGGDGGGAMEGGNADVKTGPSDAGHDAPPPGPFTIGGHVTGLSGMGFVLQNNGTDELSVPQDGKFTFSKLLAKGAAYDVTIVTEPSAPLQSCTVAHGKGTVGEADVESIEVTCANVQLYTISGTVSHLANGDSVVLQDDGADDLMVSANGSFTFMSKLPPGGMYSVTVGTQPLGSSDQCYVSQGTGTVTSADVTNVVVTCSDCGRFSKGFTGTTWSTVATNPFPFGMFMTDYLPPSKAASFYAFEGTSTASDAFTASTNTYTPLPTAPVTFSDYSTMTWYANSLWSLQGSDVVQYDLAVGTWYVPYGSLSTAQYSQTTVDNVGNLWSYSGTDSGSLESYNVASASYSTVVLPTPVTTTGTLEGRIAYDGCSELLYLATYGSTGFFSYDPVATTEDTSLSPLPSSNEFQDGFCSDRSGHIFAFVNGSNMYQYTIATDTWIAMPTGPIGNSNSACAVGADGNLYATDPEESSTMYVIQIQ